MVWYLPHMIGSSLRDLQVLSGTCPRIANAQFLLLLKKTLHQICVFFNLSDPLLSLVHRNLWAALFLALWAGGSWFVVSVTVVVIRRCVTSIICLYQGDSNKEFEMSPPCVLLLIIYFVWYSSALILTVSDIYNLMPCKWVGRYLKTVS